MDYEAYISSGGSLSREEYDELAPRAKAHVDRVIGGKAVPTEHECAYDAAVYATIGCIADSSDSGATSFTIGGFSMAVDQTPWRAKADARIRDILFPTGLLFAGVSVG